MGDFGELSEGRIVHFRGPETRERCEPAIVARVWDARMVNLCAITPDGTPHAVTNVHHEGQYASVPTWHWPGRHADALTVPPPAPADRSYAEALEDAQQAPGAEPEL